MGGRRVLTVAAVALVAAVLAAPAHATFHLISIREVYPGSVSKPDSGYVELQMYSPGQGFVKGHALTVYDAKGSIVGTFSFPANVANAASQQTILIGDSGVQAAFGVAPDLSSESFALAAAGGAACWAGSIDCVSWGTFAGSTTSASGSPADPLGIPDGMALRRTIAPGCPSLLEEADDSDDSATDFADVFPAPRPNLVAPSEHACGGKAAGEGGGGPGSAVGAAGRPRTRLRGHPGRRTGDRTPTFRFDADRPGVRFLCRLDRADYKRCHSPFVADSLRRGRHVFMVKARAPGGATDRTPAVWRFRVI